MWGGASNQSPNVLRRALETMFRGLRVRIGGGNEYLSSERDAVVVAREMTDETDAHGFADQTVISDCSDSGTYGAFDCTVEYSAAGTINHLYAFQGRGKYSGVGQLDNYASFYHAPDIDGAVVDLHGVRVIDPTGSGVITNNHGLHIRPLSRGTNNFAIFSWGSTPSIHVGQMTFGESTLDTTSAISVKTSGMTGVTQKGVHSEPLFNSAALTSGSALSARVLAAPGVYVMPEGNGLRVMDGSVGAAAEIQTQVGVNIDDLTAGTYNAAVRSKITAGSGKWGLYFTGSAQNYLAGKLGLGNFIPTAKLHISAGTAAAESAPIKLTAGVIMTTPEDGAFEFDGANLYFTLGGVRKIIQMT